VVLHWLAAFASKMHQAIFEDTHFEP